jgi:protease I
MASKKALLVVAPQNFRDEEYFHTREELEAAGIAVVTASKAVDKANGMMGGTAIVDIGLREAPVADYNAIVFIGGNGSSVYFNDKDAHELAKKAYMGGKVVAAICIAPSILANAGLLRGKKATAYPTEERNLREKGVEYTGEPLTVDGRLITADGPSSAHDFGKAIATTLENE